MDIQHTMYVYIEIVHIFYNILFYYFVSSLNIEFLLVFGYKFIYLELLGKSRYL